MHRCQAYLHQIGFKPPMQSGAFVPLTDVHSKNLSNCLREDCTMMLYSATVSLADAIRGLDENFHTWATVKLYYVVFYVARCQLALHNTLLFYITRTPFTLRTKAGDVPAKKKGQTHEVVLDEFAHLFANSRFLSQPIDIKSPLDWLRERREEANYKNPRFVESNIPSHFKGVLTHGIRKAIHAYLSDNGITYLFDPEHAMLAFPLLLWRDTINEARHHQLLDTVFIDEISFLTKAFSDKEGPLSEIIRIIKI